MDGNYSFKSKFGKILHVGRDDRLIANFNLR